MIKVRFAPSPTGYLHVGGARTALYNWLYAKNQGGEFVLRIEDTDLGRSSEDMNEVILNSMKWLGLDWDGDAILQSTRHERYREVAEKLLEEGLAYKCYCTKDELDAEREKAKNEGTGYLYSGKCRNIEYKDDNKEFVIRLRVDHSKEIIFSDIILGEIKHNNKELDDFIIMRSNGMPTYNFAVVVDDSDMGITHVIRGSDHLINTPKQINIYNALKIKPPKFGHLSMINGPDGKKLSKRHGATSVEAYQELGILPEALINYLARLGWASGDQEFFNVSELIKKFSLKKVSKAPATFDMEKLYWLNGMHMKKADPARIYSMVRDYIVDNGIVSDREIVESEEDFKRIVNLSISRHKTINSLSESLLYFFEELEFEERESRELFDQDDIKIWEDLFLFFANLDDYSDENIEVELKKYLKKTGIGMKEIGQPLRYILAYTKVTPSLFSLISCLGKKKVTERIERIIEYLR